VSSFAAGPGASAPGPELYPTDHLWPDGPLYRAYPGVFPLSSDSAWLGDFIRLKGVKTVCDLGCGGGTLLLQVLGRKPGLSVSGIDILPQAVRAARDNLSLNGFSGDILCGDIRSCDTLFRRSAYDLVVSNPPYFPQSSDQAEGARGIARTESCSLNDLCLAAAHLLHPGGRFCLVFTPGRLSELFCALSHVGLEPKRLRLVMKNADVPPCAALVESISGGGVGLDIQPPLFTHSAKET